MPYADKTKRSSRYQEYYALYPDKKRDVWYKHKYGITLQFYKDLLEQQGNVCAICKNTCKFRKRLSIDHCHATGKIRGLLCHKCNTGLGCFNDDKTYLAQALQYLEKDNG